MTFARVLPAVLFLPWAVAVSPSAGYEPPCFIDGAQSMNGRFVVTAEPVVYAGIHGPNRWRFVWKDTQTGQVLVSDARGVQGGQVYAQLFVAPDGETFALFNHVTLWSAEKSGMHGPAGLREKMGTPEWPDLEYFRHRVLVYRKNGEILRSLAIRDIATPEEWPSFQPLFNRMEWLSPYDGLEHKQVVRPAYALCRVSPDYTILELTLKPPRGARSPGRRVRISLTDGSVLAPENWPTTADKIPVPSYVGEIRQTVLGPRSIERYQPSLDPVRRSGRLRETSASPESPSAGTSSKNQDVTFERLREGFSKLDTPAWLPAEQCLLVTDLEQRKLWKLNPPRFTAEVVWEDAVRGKTGPDGRFYGLFEGKLASWRPGETPAVLADRAADGRPLSLNDLAVDRRGAIYFTTLKDPEHGRLSLADPGSRTVRVQFDGANDRDLANPNGVALSADGRFLYVGISNYKNRARSGVYRFPLRPDGSVDVAAGKSAPWAPVPGPDGIAVAGDGRVFFTAGPAIHVYSPEGKAVGRLPLPGRESGTNLTFGGPDGRTLFVTTNTALYAATIRAAAGP
ncbi:MAG TPA: SMP-30/gluconolactonase/LRE family protein [Planctomycetota bacterium]|nr:SMP-30/gluconolactonase/LRE family protein [Planctomycetota bacterium]